MSTLEIFTSTEAPVGVATDFLGNVYVSSISPQGVSTVNKYNSGKQLLYSTNIGGLTPGYLDYWFEESAIVQVQSDGNVTSIDTSTGNAQFLFNIGNLAIDNSSIYDISTGLTDDYFDLQGASYGDFAIFRRDERFTDFFITGYSRARTYPFILKITILDGLDGTLVSSKILATSRADLLVSDPTLPGRLTTRTIRGIAVNEEGTLLTTLPFQVGPESKQDELVAFKSYFNPSDGVSNNETPLRVFSGTDVYSKGITTDNNGNFYIVTNSVGSTDLGYPGTSVLFGLSARFEEFSDTSITLSELNEFGDVAINPLNRSGLTTIDYEFTSRGEDDVIQFSGNDIIFPNPCPEPTEGSDDLRNCATPETDTINGLAGNDIIYGGGGNDFLFGASGNDILSGEDGNDFLSGGSGDDTFSGGEGNDVINGGDDNDFITGGNGNDFVLTAGNGNDTVWGGVGDDTVDGGRGDDTIDGGTGNDSLNGEGGNDLVNGDEDNDTLLGDAGNDTLNGGIGDDVIEGGNGADTLVGNEGNDFLSGDGANDILSGEAGLDTLNGGAGADTLNGGDDADLLIGEGSKDIINGGEGNDTLYGNNGRDTLFGNNGNDLLFGERGTDVLEGGEGNDTIDGGSLNDVIDGGAGIDVLISGRGADTVTGGSGADTFRYNIPEDGRDTITDFDPTEDIIDLSNIMTGDSFSNPAPFDDYVTLSQSGSDTRVVIDQNGDEFGGGGRLIATLENVSASNMSGNNFIFT